MSRCSLSAAFDAALELGNAREAVELALELGESRPLEVSTAEVMLRMVGDELPLRGVLVGPEGQTLVERGFGLFERAGTPLVSASASLAMLRTPDEPAIGRVLFPVAIERGGRAYGTVRAFRLSTAGSAPPQSKPRCDEFRSAVAAGLALAAKRCGASNVFGELGRLDWSLEPDISLNAHICGGSVGLAAFVAGVSWLTKHRVPTHMAFTGVISDNSLGSVALSTFGAKLRAFRERPDVIELYCPGMPPAAGPPLSLLTQPSATEILTRVFGRRVFECFAEAARPAQKDQKELMLRLLDLLGASSRAALSNPTLTWALEATGCWPTATDLEGVALSDVLAELAHQRLVTVDDDLYRLGPAAPKRDETRIGRAHRALAAASRSRAELADLEAFHLWLGERPVEAAAALERLASRPRPLGLGPALEVLRALAAELDHGVADGLARQLAERDGPSALVALAWWCSRLPQRLPSSPFHDLSDRLGRCRSWLDRLLWVQAVAEAALHLLTSWMVALWWGTGREADDRPPKKLEPPRISRRPSLGLLQKAAGHLLEMEVASPAGEALQRELQTRLAEGMPSPARPLNQALHQPLSWCRIRGGDADDLESPCLEVARLIRPVLEALAGVAAKDDAIETAGLIADLRGEAGFYRGVIGRQVRFWAFGSGAVGSAPAPAELEPAELLWRPDVLRTLEVEVCALLEAASAPLEPPQIRIDRLPQPIAHAMVRIQRPGASALELLTMVELGVATWLRLSAFALVAAGPMAGAMARGERRWLSRMTKRALVELIDAAPTKGRGSLVDELTEDVLKDEVFELVDAHERLEHAPGPLEDHAVLVGRCARMLEVIVAGSSWQRGVFDLIGQRRSGPRASLLGVRPRLVHESMPGAAPEPGEVILSGETGTVTLSPFVLAVTETDQRGQLALLAQARGRGKQPLDELEPEYFSSDIRQGPRFFDLRWRHAPGRPFDVAPVLPADR